MFKKFIVFMLVLLVSVGTAMAATYDFYHVAVRDYNGNGIVDGNDHIRYGFVNSTGTTAKLYDQFGAEKQSKTVGSPWLYKESYNGGAWTDQNYTGVKFNHVELSGNAAYVKLYDDSGSELANHAVTIPSNPLPSAYNGYDPMTLNWQWQDGDLHMSWDAINSPSILDSSYRFTMEANIDGMNYSFFNNMGTDHTTTGFIFDSSLFDGIDYESVLWEVNFQERFVNPYGMANYNWVRSYSEFIDIDLSVDGATNPVPIPGSILLLGSGILGMVGFNRRRNT